MDGVITDGVIADPRVTASVGGVAAEVRVQTGQKVNQGDVLLTVYQPEDYQIRFSIPEELLSSVKIGAAARIYFNWNEDKSEPCSGVVTEVSYVGSQSAGGETMYDGYIAFEADESVRLGMNVTVVLE